MHMLLWLNKPSLILVFPLELITMSLFEDYMVLKDSEIFSPSNCTQFLKTKLIDRGFALVFIDDNLLLAHTKTYMLVLIEQLTTTPDLWFQQS